MDVISLLHSKGVALLIMYCWREKIANFIEGETKGE